MLQTVSIESDSGSDYIFNKPWARAYAYLLGLACSFGFHTQGLAILQSKRNRRRQSGGHRADAVAGSRRMCDAAAASGMVEPGPACQELKIEDAVGVTVFRFVRSMHLVGTGWAHGGRHASIVTVNSHARAHMSYTCTHTL